MLRRYRAYKQRRHQKRYGWYEEILKQRQDEKQRYLDIINATFAEYEAECQVILVDLEEMWLRGGLLDQDNPELVHEL